MLNANVVGLQTSSTVASLGIPHSFDGDGHTSDCRAVAQWVVAEDHLPPSRHEIGGGIWHSKVEWFHGSTRLSLSPSEGQLNPFDTTRQLIAQFMFPKPDDFHAQPLKHLCRLPVPNPVTLDLGPPELAIGFRIVPAPTAAVPEASINENRQTPFWEIEIWPSGYFLRGDSPSAEAKPHEGRTEPDLGGSITASFHGTHAFRAFFADANELTVRQLFAKESLHGLNAFVVEGGQCGCEPEQLRIGERFGHPSGEALAWEHQAL